MANIIAVLNPKGGAGKTTIALHLSRELKEHGSVLMVDSDPQGSARDWAEQGGGNSFPIVGVDRAGALKSTIQQIAPSYDWVVIDGAAKLEEMAAHAVSIAELIIIPVQPSPLDLWACEALVSHIKQRQIITDGIPTAAFQISRAKKGTTLAKDVRKVVAEYELPLLDGNIHDRTVFAKSLSDGSTAIDVEPNGAAAFEIRHLVKQIIKGFE
ncbi:ParA family partition ATPase [Vibrio campbellii]|uniref:ParA family partition ATPase n=1 Tax=Vibrio campbellii TaxID=680 RepID=UPI001F299126|nr:ParA family partition ATPase [Vibrio campbellii]MCE7733208.1 AAA family ATPase [Vibrio campbellii]